MRQETTQGVECGICNRMVALKTRAASVERFIGNVLRPAPPVNVSPRQAAAIAWHADISAYLRKEMAPHAKCRECGILMGPGHVEAGDSPMCGTCATRRLQAQASYHAERRRSTIGRRGWLSDYTNH